MNKDKLYLGILIVISAILFVGIYWVERRLGLRLPQIFLERPFVPANIVVNAKHEYGPMPQIWRGLAQGGEEMGKSMIKPTVSFLSRIRPSYIRLDHIYDDDYYGVVRGRNGNGTLNLNWSKLDETVNDITATGAKPFLSLTYMPKLIAESKIGVPNWRDWQDLVRQTVQHYSSLIDGVYYEVWNEPSLPMFGDWKMYGDKDYRNLYGYAVAGANQAVSTFPYKIGGPAIPELDPRWVKLLFDYVLQNNLRLDFISWHRYHFDPQQFVNDVYEINVITDDDKYKQFANIEKVITEWGPNSYKDSIYSSPVAASHMIAVVRQLLDKTNLLMAFEVKDGPGQGKMGWGLLTHESVGVREKPRFLLFDWLNDFTGTRVEVLGEGSQITGFAAKNDRTVSLLLTNYNLGGGGEEAFQVTFGNLDPGKYRLVQRQLFGETTEKEIEIKTASFVINASMPVYSVSRFDLTLVNKLEIALAEPAQATPSGQFASPMALPSTSPSPSISPVPSVGVPQPSILEATPENNQPSGFQNLFQDLFNSIFNRSAL